MERRTAHFSDTCSTRHIASRFISTAVTYFVPVSAFQRFPHHAPPLTPPVFYALPSSCLIQIYNIMRRFHWWNFQHLTLYHNNSLVSTQFSLQWLTVYLRSAVDWRAGLLCEREHTSLWRYGVCETYSLSEASFILNKCISCLLN